MPIVEADVRFRASLRRTDFPDGGGVMTSTVIVDGLDNNLFDDITDIERLNGKLSLRKVFGAALNADNDTYLSAHAILEDQPADAATAAFVMAGATLGEERAAALVRLRAGAPGALTASIATGGDSTTGSATATAFTIPDTSLIDSNLGQWFRLSNVVLGVESFALRRVLSRSGNDLTFSSALPWTSTVVGLKRVAAFPKAGAPDRVYGSVSLSSGPSLGAASLSASSLLVQLVPIADGGPVSASYEGFGTATGFDESMGMCPALLATDAALIHSTQSMAPATVANADVINTGRTNLSRLRVVGNSGVVHASFVANQPAPSGVGCTANLTSGTVTFSDVSGMSQPVTVEHRIEELAVVSSLDLGAGTINLTRGISRAYPSGAKVSPLLMLGDLQGRIQLGFSQSAWTGVWSDTRIGGEPTADFNLPGYPITTTNKGSVNERWFIQFTSTTAFKLIGESLGEVGTGGTGADFSPINPATGSPYVTIPYLGWSAGWAAGNVYRFNTAGANAPLWVGRSVAPSVPAGDDKVTLQLRGYVNA